MKHDPRDIPSGQDAPVQAAAGTRADSTRLLSLAREILRMERAHRQWRERHTLNLIASHSVMSVPVRRLLSSSFADRRTSGRLGVRWHGGGEYIDEMERSALAIIRESFDADCVEYRAITCSQANQVAIAGLVTPHGRMIAPGRHIGGDPSVRGHPLTSQTKDIYDLPFDISRWNVDLEALRRLALAKRPELIVVGTSMPLFPYPLGEVRSIADEVDARVMVDGAHLLGFIPGGQIPSPLMSGAHVLTGSTQKTLGAPIGGLLLTNDQEIYGRAAEAVDRLVASYHIPVLAATAVAIAELAGPGRDFAQTVVQNAQALGATLAGSGLRAISVDGCYSRTHQVLIQFETLQELDRAFTRLSAAGVLATPTGAGVLPILRFGVTEITRLGMKAEDMAGVGETVARIVLDYETPDRARERVTSLVEGREIQYGFADEDLI
jgi:glycine hydroxymethyltransferase